MYAVAILCVPHPAVIASVIATNDSVIVRIGVIFRATKSVIDRLWLMVLNDESSRVIVPVPMLTDSLTDLVAAKILLSPSVIDIESDIVLNVFIKRDMLSPILTESDTDLNADINRDNESPIVTESDIVLNDDNSLEILSVIEIDTPVIVLNVDIPLVTESVISYVPCGRSN